MISKTLIVNGMTKTLLVNPEDSLADVLRGQLLLTSVKVGCGTGQCGACNVILDGKLVRTCTLKMKRVEDGAAVTTLEGIGTPEHMHPLQLSWMFHGGAQCGFCTPGFIVSAKCLLDNNPAPTRNDVRDWFQSHRNACRCTGYKPLVDAVMDAAAVMRGEKSVKDIEYKEPVDGRTWGSRRPRPNAVAKVTGTHDFGADTALKMPPNTLHLALAQAKVSHANIKGIDTSEAEAMPGVYRVLTHKDVKGKNRITGLITFPTNKGDGWDRPILNDTKIFQYGDALAIVCADSEAHARAAADKVKFDLELLPEYLNAPDAMAPDAIEIHPGTPNTYFEQKEVKGQETAPFFADANNVVAEGSYYTQRQPHLPIEPDVGYGYMNEEGKLVIHSKSIGLHLHGLMIAPGLGLDFGNDMVMVQCNAGGTFGYKFSPTMEALIGVAVASAVMKGMLMLLVVEPDSSIFAFSAASRSRWRAILSAERSMEADWIVDHGPYSEFGDLLTLRGAQYIGAGYGIENIRGLGRTVCTNHGWGAAFRGYGAPESEFASEVLIDELAEKLGMEWHFSKAIDRDGGEYGDAVLSKYPILEKRSYRLPCAAEQPGEDRSLCVIRVQIDGKDLYVASTHLDHLSGDASRLVQATEIRRIRDTELEGDLILCGDLNAIPSSNVIATMTSFLTNTGPIDQYTFPSDDPSRKIDYIMYAPIEHFGVQNCQVVSRGDQQVGGVDASDHRPVIADIRFQTEEDISGEDGGGEE